ncbi:MAG: ArnT family glycosyltransferase [Candidatus Levyibacteriota bacterium]
MGKLFKNELILFLGIFLLGAFLRLYHLDFPLGLHGDEAWTGIEAQRILATGSIGIWSPGAYGQIAVPFYWTAFIFKFFGASLMSLRFSFTILTVLSLPFFYLFVKELFGKKIALISFFLFCCSRIFIHFGHIAYSVVFLPLFPTLYFFQLMMKRKKVIFAIATGFFLGTAMYGYVGLRLLPVFVGIFFLYTLVSKKFAKVYIKQIVVCFFTFVVVIFPIILFAISQPENFWSRANSISLFSSGGLIHELNGKPNTQWNRIMVFVTSMEKTAGMFNFRGDNDSQDNNDALPVFDLFTGIFFLAGIVIQLKKIKNEQSIFLFLLFLLFLTGSVFTVDAPNFRRVQPAIASAYIFVAIGLIGIEKIAKRFLPSQKNVFVFLLIIATGVIGIVNIDYYFTKQGISSQTKTIFSYRLVKVANVLHTLPQPLYVFFYSDSKSYSYETLRFLVSDIPGENDSKQFGTFSLINTHPFRHVAYVFFPEYEDTFVHVQKMYPGGQASVIQDTDNTLLFYLYFLPSTI